MYHGGDTSGPASVDYQTFDGTAKQKSDFEYAAGTLTFAPGEVSKVISVLINEDMLIEEALLLGHDFLRSRSLARTPV